MTTVDVGIRELEARLSEYVERAAKGQTIRVTDRGKVKAVLGPVPGDLNLDEGIAAGWIRPGEGETPTTWKRFPPAAVCRSCSMGIVANDHLCRFRRSPQGVSRGGRE